MLRAPGARIHAAATLFACVLIPAYSRLTGAGGLAWTMFARSAAFRLELRAVDGEGNTHVLHPAELARKVEPSLRFYLLGADRFHTWPVGPTFLRHLPELAKLGCDVGDYRTVELTLMQRSTLDAPLRVTHARAACPRG